MPGVRRRKTKYFTWERLPDRELLDLPYGRAGSPLVVDGLVVAGSGNGPAGEEFVAVRPGSPDGSRKPKLAMRGPTPRKAVTGSRCRGPEAAGRVRDARESAPALTSPEP